MHMLTATFIGLLSCCFLFAAKAADLQTEEFVDLDSYLGKWYEIAKYPNRFQRKCVRGTTATYSAHPKGGLEVLNECYLDKDKQRKSSAKGRAWVVDSQSNSKLKVQFFWPFRGDYWILELGDNYEYVVVGEPKRRYLWVLSRNPEMSDEVYEDILSRLSGRGYEPKRLERSLH